MLGKLVAASVAAVLVIEWLAMATIVLGASPSPSTGTGGDPRSSGQGPGLVGDPVFAVLAVAAIGLASLVITLAYVRLTGRRRA